MSVVRQIGRIQLVIPSLERFGYVFPTLEAFGSGDFVYWATGLFREAQAPAQVRARLTHAEGPGEAQIGPENPQGAQRAYRTKAKY